MEEVISFSQEKQKYLEKLINCKKNVQQLEKELDTDLTFYKEKLDKAIQKLNDEKLKIVFFGSFSDGKSTILAALTGNSGIEIAPEPTTDEVQTYAYKDFLLVDTPGLFSENIPHDERTKKFISEADLIIFTTEAVNPLKDSQHEVIRWILKDLGKLSQTVFVINKMDTVADLYSKEDFHRTCKIKKETIKKTLNKILGEERNDYLIVCLSADPWGMGLDHWFQNKGEYKELSNIEELENIVNSVVKEKKEFLKKNAIEAILKDISIRSSNELEEKMKELEISLKETELEYKNLCEQLGLIRRELGKAVGRIKSRLNSLRETLIDEFYACNTLDCLKEIADKKVGKEGCALKTQTEIIIQEEIEPIYEFLNATSKILERIAQKLENIELLNTELMRLGSSILQKTGKVLQKTSVDRLRNAILKIRDFLRLPVKFRPWEVVKLAELLKKLAPLLDVIPLILKVWERRKFEESKDKMINNINSFFDELDKQITLEFIKENYFAPILELEKAEQELATTLYQYKELLKKYRKAEIIFKKCVEEVE